MTQEVATTNQFVDLDSLDDAQLQALWQKKNTTQRSNFNSITLDNSKLDSEGEKNESFGSITAKRYDGDDVVEEKLSIGSSFYPVKTRVQIECRNYVTDSNGKKYPQFICKEVGKFEDIEVVDYATKEVVFRGPYKQAKEAYDLKYKLAVYAYYNDYLYRWVLGGKETLGSWFSIGNQINDAGRPHSVILKNIVPQNNANIFWNDLDFELSEEFSIKKALELESELEGQFKATVKKAPLPAPVNVEVADDIGEVVIDEVAI
jgi:hypothetical protein